ncbi:RNA polymerase sigma factor [Variovorax sp. J22R115]|uniref:RNA polymerase sigma factor n=1 Tax=Variovorax sp. J22R115 TaxID=3053509 RepID=UPI002578A8B6|nr:sigma-70 family RNA polymerase sigma factor [Variovorax sp. J22R115]MDM0048194.1 sigma-70 family RNA polymerase sigma factor [Variovorax sp. J22R115]
MDNDEVNKLLARIGREDQAAFRQLYKAFSRKVYAYVLNMLSDHARAEEVLADSFYEVWRHPERFRGDSQFSTWLIGIARRKALMVYRARRPDEVHWDLDDIAETTASDTPDGYVGAGAVIRWGGRRLSARHAAGPPATRQKRLGLRLGESRHLPLSRRKPPLRPRTPLGREARK